MSYADKITYIVTIIAGIMAALELTFAKLAWWEVPHDGKNFIIFLLVLGLIHNLIKNATLKNPAVKRGKLTSEEQKKIAFGAIVSYPLAISITTYILVTLGNIMS
ncbi:MAG: hypothetical protein ABI444_07915 [Candidatus Kapaibacterium sp.]|jgi:hypothetical protein